MRNRVWIRFVLLVVCGLIAVGAWAQEGQPCATPAGAPSPVDGHPACSAESSKIACKEDGSGYVYSVTVTNHTGQTVTDIHMTPPPGAGYTISPQTPFANGALADGASVTLTVTITGGTPGQQICFPITLITKERTCCTIQVCVKLPNCCGIVKDLKLACVKPGTFTYTFTVTNSTPNTIQHIYLYPPAGVTFTPDYFPVNLGPGQTSPPLTVTITGAQPGAQLCFDLSLHTPEMKACCTIRQCIKLPDCGPPPADVSLDKKFTKGPEANRGVYTLTVKNEGAGPIIAGTAIKITDPVPSGVTLTGFSGGSGTSWNCTPAFPVTGPNTLTCNYIGAYPIAAGATLPPLNLAATLASAGSQTGIYSNCASVAMTNPAGPVTETNMDNNRDCAVTNQINPNGCDNADCPHPTATCKQDVLLVVDASQSIGNNGLSWVKTAISKFLQAMAGKGGRVNIFSFSNHVSNSQYWTPITNGWTTVTSANYATLANPIALTGTRTNWDDALEHAYNVVQANPGPELVLFITDGDPNTSNDTSGAEVDNSGMPVTAATEAVQWINAIRAAGSPLIGIGFGQVASAGYLDAAFTGNSSTSGNVSLETSSVIKMNSVNELPGVMGTLGNQMCGTLSLNKRNEGPSFYSHAVNAGTSSSQVNDTFSFALDLTNNSTTAISGIEVQDQVPSVLTNVAVTSPTNGTSPASPPGNLIKWSGINMPARSSATLKFSGKLSKTYPVPSSESFTNYAQVTAAQNYTATTLGNMNPTTGPAAEPDESFATFGESVYVFVDPCAGANKPDYCYLSVSKNKKNVEDNCSSAASTVTPCTFTVGMSLNYIPTGATVTVADNFTMNGNPVTWNAVVPAGLCSGATPAQVPFNCTHGTLNGGDITVMIPPGQTGTMQNCLTVTISSTSPPLNVTKTACVTP